jgi:hypothetical protein
MANITLMAQTIRFARQYESCRTLGKIEITMTETISHQRRWVAFR